MAATNRLPAGFVASHYWQVHCTRCDWVIDLEGSTKRDAVAVARAHRDRWCEGELVDWPDSLAVPCGACAARRSRLHTCDPERLVT